MKHYGLLTLINFFWTQPQKLGLLKKCQSNLWVKIEPKFDRKFGSTFFKGGFSVKKKSSVCKKKLK